MSTQPPVETWDEGVDLRSYINVVIRYRWLVAGMVATVVAVTGFVSYAMLDSTYESTVIVTLPAASGENGLGLVPQGYEEFAISEPVLLTVRRILNIDDNPGVLPGDYEAQLIQGEGARLMSVTASAKTPDDALLLADVWVDAFGQRSRQLLVNQLSRKNEAATESLDALLVDLIAVEDAVAAMDQETPLSLQEARIESLESELVSGEERLREINVHLIPTDEALISFLEASLAVTPQFLGGVPEGVAQPGDSSGATSAGVIILNPLFLSLSQDLTAARSRLVANRLAAENLVQRIPALELELKQLVRESVAAREERQRLVRQEEETRTLYEAVRENVDAILATETRLPELSRSEIAREAELPREAVAPRRVFNIILAGVLAALVGMLIAFFLEWYRNTPAAGRESGRREPASGPGDG